ncbi:hypothetical protein M427DRAFT_54263 [Gonapodya prolifera JEL478]|uniref:peptidylprolyl isomerase n=1 Tax=Gonapodya prolifera (strain JEL478) TaxID=1344416 RepID=A0A139AMR0_GONPJ|nr:hypothetical protein M427DRAFT_54263 [Gonapodya prolifera JEL478]|eukprot:KXS18056.1 hypothetical protein M427DRAFT_54263 [Gonapodya prolifera JEL478]
MDIEAIKNTPVPEAARKKQWTTNVERIDNLDDEIAQSEQEEALVREARRQDAMQTMQRVAADGADPRKDGPTYPEPDDIADIPDTKDEDDDLPPLDAVLEEGDDLLIAPGVNKKLLKKGQGWTNPQEGDEAYVTYVGRLAKSGTEFDRHEDREKPFSFIVGHGTVIHGWDIVLPTMKPHERALVTIAPEYAYGEDGIPPTIPPNAVLEFEIELIGYRASTSLDPSNTVRLYKTHESSTPGAHKLAKPGWECAVRYTATFTSSSTPFDYSSSHSGSPRSDLFTFTIPPPNSSPSSPPPTPDLPPLLAAAVLRLRQSESGRYTVPPELARGCLGVPEGVAEEFVYEVEVVEVREIVDLEGGKIRKKIIADGTGYHTPKDGTSVHLTVSITSRTNPALPPLVLGTDMDPFSYVLGSGLFPESVEVVLPTMLKGSRVVISAGSEFGFTPTGAKSVGWNGGESEDMDFDVTLFDWDWGKDAWDLTSPERVALAARLKMWGNEMWKLGRYRWAGRKWEAARDAMRYKIEMTPEDEVVERDVEVSVRLNLTNWYVRDGKWSKVLEEADKVLALAPTNVKALYRRAQSLAHAGRVDDAYEALTSAMCEDSKDGKEKGKFEAELKGLMSEVQKRRRKAAEKEKTVYRNMFKERERTKEKAATNGPEEKPAQTVAVQEKVRVAKLSTVMCFCVHTA